MLFLYKKETAIITKITNEIKKNIIVTNDDGVDSPGLHSLAECLSSLGNVYIIAPKDEKSAIGHSVTIHHPLRAKEIKKNIISIDGTPSDCVIFGALHLLKGQKVDLVASGINLGPNLGDDITYSGTVGAAMEGTLLKIPSMAISLAGRNHADFTAAASFSCNVARYLLENGLPPLTLLNINVPNEKDDNIKGYLITRQGKGIYRDNIVEKIDPRGKKYFWIDGDEPRWETENGEDTDFHAVANKYISLTPLIMDLTNHALLDSMRKKIKEFENLKFQN